MIREYGLQPDMLSNWKDFRYFTEKFSAAQGRLISRFPSSWKRMVYEACAACGYMEKKRIEEGLSQIGHRLLQNGRAYDSSQTWPDNAIQSHATKPFHAVIAEKAVPGHAYVLASDEVSDSHPLFQEKHSATVPRDPEALAGAAAMLLAISKEIVFVDPYFRPTKTNCRVPLERFFDKIAARDGQLPKRVELHIGDNISGDPNTAFERFKNDCESNLPQCVPVGMELTIVRWSQAGLHNRFILTDRAALMYGTGLDQATSTGTQTDDVTLLDESVRADRWADYAERTGGLTPAGDPADIVIVGTRNMDN